jgi:hypothetical protein
MLVKLTPAAVAADAAVVGVMDLVVRGGLVAHLNGKEFCIYNNNNIK